MRLHPKNWLNETRSQETERRLSAVESSTSELWLEFNSLGNRLLILENLLTPPDNRPEVG